MKFNVRGYCATEPFLLLYWMATEIHLSILPQLVIKKLCLQKYNSTVCSSLDSGEFSGHETIIHKEAADWNIAILLITYIPSIFTVIAYGLASDIIGKRILLLLPPLTLALQSVIYLLSAKFMASSVRLLVFGASVTCLFGDLQGAIMLAYSYLADITSADQHRSFRMAILESTIFIGQSSGSYFAGLLLQRFNFVVVFSTSLVICILNFVYVAVILPSTESHSEYVNADELVAGGHCTRLLSNIGRSLRQIPVRLKSFAAYLSCSREGKILIPILLAVVFTNAAVLGENGIIVLFLKHSPLNLSPSKIGQYICLLHITRGFGVIIVAVIVMKIFKPSDLVLALIGLTSLFLTHIFMGISRTPAWLYTTTPVSICIPLAMSAFRSIITKHVSPKDHTTSLTSVAVVSYIGLVVITCFSNDIYKITASYFSGAAILLLAVSTSIAFFIILALYVITICRKKNDGGSTVEMAVEETYPLIAAENNETEGITSDP